MQNKRGTGLAVVAQQQQTNEILLLVLAKLEEIRVLLAKEKPPKK